MFILIVGPMFSGKSSMLLNYERRFKIAKKNILTINHSFDVRYSEEGKIVTHDKTRSLSENHLSLTTEQLNKIIENKYGNFENVDVMLIDEIQFFDNLDEFIAHWTNAGKTIIGAGLNSDYRKKPFPNMNNLFSIADKIVHICATCKCCGEDAPFTKRLVNESKEQVVIGGAESYEPRCRKCFMQ